MKSNNKNTKKKSNLRIMATFFIILAICYISGYLLGRVMKKAEGKIDIKSAAEILRPYLITWLPVFFIAFNIIIFIVSLIIYLKCNRLAKDWDAEDESSSIIDNVERLLNYPLLLSNICMICNFFLYPAIINVSTFGELEIGEFRKLSLIASITFIAGMAFIMIIQNLIVTLEKKLNPEKKGNIFDKNFNKDWENSMDEAQIQMCYKAGFYAFKRGNAVCLILWIVSFMSMMFFDTGVMPIFMICVIYMVLIVSYIRMAAKLENGEK